MNIELYVWGGDSSICVLVCLFLVNRVEIMFQIAKEQCVIKYLPEKRLCHYCTNAVEFDDSASYDT